MGTSSWRSLLAVADTNLVALGMDVDDEEGSTNVRRAGRWGEVETPEGRR